MTHNTVNGSLLYKDEVYEIQGAVFEVYRQMGAGFLEAVYQECLERECTARNILFREIHEQKPLGDSTGKLAFVSPLVYFVVPFSL
jgi:hypothetical protein